MFRMSSLVVGMVDLTCENAKNEADLKEFSYFFNFGCKCAVLPRGWYGRADMRNTFNSASALMTVNGRVGKSRRFNLGFNR